jgi:hypothetical protein
MSSIEQLKSEAAALEAKARAQGHPMKHCDALSRSQGIMGTTAGVLVVQS